MALHTAPPHTASPSMNLSMVSPGETVELLSIRECPRLRKRLADLGLNAGSRVRVVQNHFAGPLLLAVRGDARLAIGRGMAHKIRVCPYRGTLCDACDEPCDEREPVAPRESGHNGRLTRRADR